MITLLHGDDTTKSRTELVRLKHLTVGKELRELDGKLVNEDILIQALSSSSLFGGDTPVTIDNLFSSQGKKLKRIETLATIIKRESTNVDVLLWEEKEVGKTALTQLGTSITVKLFKLPVIIFQFLDSVRPQNSPSLLRLYTDIVKQEAPELVHVMLLRRLRQLMELKSGIAPVGLQSWQSARLTNQAQSFTIDQLLQAYKRVVTNDLSMKTGTGALSIRANTELLLSSL